jgi:hypothetical protein
MFIHSFCLHPGGGGVRGRCCILVSRNLKAAILCSYGWLDVKWINVSTVVGFLYISISVSLLVM